MARPLRLEFAGALYHITSRGNERKPIYLEDSDFELFLDILNSVCERYHWVVHAYCLMTNHYHLLLETPDANLSKGMRQLNGVFTQSFNRKHEREGHLFQGRYKAILVEKDSYLLELSRYILLNPIRVGMVETLEEWPWSSWHSLMGLEDSPSWLETDALLRRFAKYRKIARAKYAEFVRQGIEVNPWSHVSNQMFLGSEEFISKHLEKINALGGDLSEIPKKYRRIATMSLQDYDESTEDRDQAMVDAYSSGDFTLKEIGEYFGLHYSRVSRIVAKNKN